MMICRDDVSEMTKRKHKIKQTKKQGIRLNFNSPKVKQII